MAAKTKAKIARGLVIMGLYESSGYTIGVITHFFCRSFRHDHSSSASSFGTEVDHIIAGTDDIGVRLGCLFERITEVPEDIYRKYEINRTKCRYIWYVVPAEEE